MEFLMTYEAKFCSEFSQVLLSNGCPYSIVKNHIIPITNPTEIEEIQIAVDNQDVFPGVFEHLNSAMNHMNTDKNRDYSISIHESISAVESVLFHFIRRKKQNLKMALNALEGKYNKKCMELLNLVVLNLIWLYFR